MILERDTWQEIISTIRKNKLRTALTALGVFWGIFMLVFILGMGNGLETGVFRNFGSGAKNIMFVWSEKTTVPYKGMAPGRRVRLSLNDIDAVEQINGVASVSPRTFIGNKPVRAKGLSTSYGIRGELPEAQNIQGYIVDEGRYLNQLDIDEGRKVALLGRTVKKELFGDESSIGKHIQISGIDFLVIGVFATPDAKEWNMEEMENISVPITTVFKSFGVQNERVDQCVVSANPGILVSEIEPKVRSLLKERHQVAPEDKRGINGFNLEEEFKSVQNLFVGIKALLWFVGIGTLIAGIVGVSNIMLITVKERTKEIGIRKALGASPSSIVSMILTESIFITSIAGYLGLMTGTFMIITVNYLMIKFGIENQNFYDPKVNLTIAVSALVFLIVAGGIAGLIPALQAAKVNPVVALKDE